MVLYFQSCWSTLLQVRVIQGDGIDFESLQLICAVLADKEWSINNIAFGSGEFCFASSDSLVELEVDLVGLEVGEVEFVETALFYS